MTGGVDVLCFQEEDVAFGKRVRELVELTERDGPFHAAVEAVLKETYPLAVISPRAPVAAIDAKEVWYVFRDGGVLSRRVEST